MKVFLRKTSPWPLAGFSFLVTSLILITVSAAYGFPGIGPGFLPAVAVTVAINTLATILLYRALAQTDLSLCIPMLAFTPVFLILTSFLILGELPTVPGAIGILLVAAGAYLLHLEYCRGRPVSLITPFRTLQRDRGVQVMLFVAFLYSISVNYDKQVVTGSDPIFGSAVVLFLLSIPFLLITLYVRSGRSLPLFGSPVPPVAKPGAPSVPVPVAYLAVGVVLALEAISVNVAYTMTVVPYVITVKRLAIFFSVLFGGVLLGEQNLGSRMFGGLVMIAGAVMIALMG